MISQLPLISLLAILVALVGIFLLMRSFKLPGSFNENRKKREAYLRELERRRVRERAQAEKLAKRMEAEEKTREEEQIPESFQGQDPAQSPEAPRK
jgi:predicted Holliday junction resolvase-like endonuclease